MGRGQTLSQQQPSYYGGSTVVGPTAAEGAAWDARNANNSQVFGSNQYLNYGSAANALNGTLTGGGTVAGMAGTLAPQATDALTQGFKPPDTSGITGMGQSNAAGGIGQYGFGTSLDPNGRAPTFGVAGGLDARGAYQSMLNGQPDYQGVQGAIDAANAPIMRQFNEQIMPGLNSQATFTNNSTGGIKALNRVLPEIGDRMAQNAQSITNQERVRALGAQQDAANAVSQGGMQGYGLGLQTAQGERGLEQNLAGLGLQTDTTRGQLAQNDFSGNLQQQGMAQDANDRYRGDLLNYGSLAGQLGSQAQGQQLQAAGLFPSLYQTGRTPGDDALQYANYDRATQEDALGADVDKFNYLRDQPYNNLGWYGNLISGAGSQYGQTTQTGPAGSRAAGALGGALAGSQLGGGLAQGMGYGGGYGQLIGALLGGYAGYGG